jgi:hypothetical protein
VSTFVGSCFGVSAHLDTYVAIALLLPAVTILLLVICATIVALAAGSERSERAQVVLVHLLDALRAVLRCARGKK